MLLWISLRMHIFMYTYPYIYILTCLCVYPCFYGKKKFQYMYLIWMFWTIGRYIFNFTNYSKFDFNIAVLIYLPTRNMWPHTLSKPFHFRLSIKLYAHTAWTYNYLIDSELCIFFIDYLDFSFYNYSDHIFMNFSLGVIFRNYLYIPDTNSFDIYMCYEHIYLSKFPANIQSSFL